MTISAVKTLQRQLLDTQERFQVLVEQLPAVTYITEPERVAAGYVSPQIVGLLGFSLEEWKAHPDLWLQRLHPDDRERALAVIDPTKRRGGEGVVAEYRVLHKDGHIIWVQDHAAPLFDGAGKPVAQLGVIFDVTERKSMEQELQARADELARANQALAEANRYKTEFLANLSHELRTPLNAILGFTDLCESGAAGPLNPTQLGYARDVAASGRQMLALVNNLIDIARYEAGRLELHLAPLDISAALQGWVGQFQREAEQRGIRLELECGPAHGVVEVDETRLRQMLAHLLSNALKFTPYGGVVRVRAGKVACSRGEAPAAGCPCPCDAEASLRIAVCDTGIGISPEEIPRLFQPFAQLDGGLDRRAGGTGIGLALALRLARLHGGCLVAQGEPGKGSCFEARLPWRDGDPPVAAK